MAKTRTTRTMQQRWSSGTDAISRVDFDTDAANLELYAVTAAEGTLAARPAATAANKNTIYTVIGDSTAENNGRQYFSTGSTWVNASSSYSTGTIAEPSAVDSYGLLVRGLAGQTADLIRVNSSTGASLFSVSATGQVSNRLNATSPGVSLGNIAAHGSSLFAQSVDAGLPVAVLKGAASQTGSLLSLRASNDAVVASVSPAGLGTFTGLVSNGLSDFVGTTETDTLNVSAGLNGVNALFTATSASNVPLQVKGFAAQAANLVNFLDSAGNGQARITANGSFATSNRVNIGANSGSGTANTSGSALNVAGLTTTSPVATLTAASGQTGQLLKINDFAGVDRWTVDASGNSIQTGVASTTGAAIGVGPNTPSSLFGGGAPIAEFVTGTSTASYKDDIVVRHSQNGNTPVSRRVGILFKLSNEGSQIESNKSAGIGVQSTALNAIDPSLVFDVGGTESARLSATGDLTVVRDIIGSATSVLRMRTGNRAQILLTDSEYASIGTQPSSMYFRAGNFNWYANGTFIDTQGSPGTGGVVAMALKGSTSDNLLNVGRLELTDVTGYNSATPALSIGARNGNHMQFSTQHISSWSGTATTASNAQKLSLNPTGDIDLSTSTGASTITLGNSDALVKIPSRTIFVGANKVYFGSNVYAAAGGGPQENDWWFDHSNNQIKVRNAANVWKVMADDDWIPQNSGF